MAQQRRGGRRRRKVDFIAANHIEYIDYKDTNLLDRFISERGKILPRRVTGTSAKNQRSAPYSLFRFSICPTADLHCHLFHIVEKRMTNF